MADTTWQVPYSAQQLQDAWANCAPRISANYTWETWDIENGDWVDTQVNATAHNPYIGTANHWFVWDDSTSAYVDSGLIAGYTAYTGTVEAVT